MSSRSPRIGAGVVVVDPGWLWVHLRAGVGVGGFEWGEAVRRESEAGDSFERALQVLLIDDRPCDLGLTVTSAEVHPIERRRVAWAEFSFDDEAKAR